MNNKIYLNGGIALLATIGLVACNGGNSTSSTATTQTSPLQQYISSLTYTSANGKSLTAGGTQQQSFTTPGGLTINSVDIKFYSGANCTGTNVFTQTLNSSGTNPVTPAAGTYSSNNASNNALCTAYTNGPSSGCAGLYGQMQNGNMRSMQYTYNIDNGSGGSYAIVAGCMYNPNAVVGTTTGVEGVANWSATNVNSDCTGGTCGFSQPYAVTLGTASSFFRPAQLVLNNAGSYAYVVDWGSGVLKCTIDQATGNLVGSCINMNVGDLSTSMGIALESEGRYAYVTSRDNSTIKKCDINLSGDFINCGDSGAGNNLIPNPIGIIQSNSTMYIAGGSAVWGCAIDDSGILGNCQQVNGTNMGQDIPFATYLANGGTNYTAGFFVSRSYGDMFLIKKCPYNSYGVTCDNAYDGMGMSNNKPVGVAVNGNIGYITYYNSMVMPGQGQSLLTCNVDNNGNFSNCSTFSNAALTDPQQITINSTGTVAYIANASSGNVAVCTLDGSGVPTSCTTAQ